MKSFKLTADGDLSFTDGDKMKPYTITGKSYQTGTPSPDNPLPIIGVTTSFFYDYDGTDTHYQPERLVLHGIEDELGNIYADTIDVDPIKKICTLTRRVGINKGTGVVSYSAVSIDEKQVAGYLDLRDNHGLSWGYPIETSDSRLKFLCSHFPNNEHNDRFNEYIADTSFAKYEGRQCALWLKSERFTEEQLTDYGTSGHALTTAFNLFLNELGDMQVLFPLEREEVFEFPYTTTYNHQIEMVEGAELTCQKIKTVLGTNKGEWFFDEEEGINFDNILGKRSVQNSTTSKEIVHTTETKVVKKIVVQDGFDEELNALNEQLEKRLDGVQ